MSFHAWQNKNYLKPEIVFQEIDIGHRKEAKFLGLYLTEGTDKMHPLETKKSLGKILPHSDLRGGVFLEEALRNRKRKK